MIPAYEDRANRRSRPSDPRLITATGSGDGDSGVGEIQQCYTAVGRPLFTEPDNHGLVARAWSASFDEPDLGSATIATKTHKRVRARRCLTARRRKFAHPTWAIGGPLSRAKGGHSRCFPGKPRKLETRSCAPERDLPSWPCEFDSRHPLHRKIPSHLPLSSSRGPKMIRRLRALGPLWAPSL